MRAVSYHLIDLVQNLGRPRILVLGDLILDRYTWGDAERISQEAPVILLRADKREERLGGASSVATMLRALGARTSVVGVVGLVVGGWPILTEAFENILDRRMTMELSMSIALIAALSIREVFTARPRWRSNTISPRTGWAIHASRPSWAQSPSRASTRCRQLAGSSPRA